MMPARRAAGLCWSRRFGRAGVSGAAALALCCTSQAALAQVQDDAALADVPHEPKASGDAVEHEPPTGYPGSASSDPTPATEAPSEPELPPPLTTAQLRAAYHDLEVRSTPMPLFTLGFTSIYPFQTLGFGVGVDVYVSPRLRLSGAVSVGASPVVNDKWNVAFYGEPGIGIVLVRSASETETEIKSLLTTVGRNFHSKRSGFERFMLGPEPPPPGSFVRAIVPSFHSFELEGGLFSGTFPFHRCTANCTGDPTQRTNEDASRMVTSLFAGVRYAYFRWARSAQAPFVTRFGFEAAIDAITNPFWRDDTSLLNLRDFHPAAHRVGARAKVRLVGVKCGPNGGCIGFDVIAGYLPAPEDALMSLSMVFE